MFCVGRFSKPVSTILKYIIIINSKYSVSIAHVPTTCVSVYTILIITMYMPFPPLRVSRSMLIRHLYFRLPCSCHERLRAQKALNDAFFQTVSCVRTSPYNSTLLLFNSYSIPYVHVIIFYTYRVQIIKFTEFLKINTQHN